MGSDHGGAAGERAGGGTRDEGGGPWGGRGGAAARLAGLGGGGGGRGGAAPRRGRGQLARRGLRVGSSLRSHSLCQQIHTTERGNGYTFSVQFLIDSEQLAQYQREHVKHVEVKEEQNEQAQLWLWAKSHHFCVSTFAQPGVYGAVNGGQVNPTELVLRSVRSELAHEHMQRKLPRTIRKVDVSCDKETDAPPNTTLQLLKSAQSESPRGRLEFKRWRQIPASLSLRASSDYDSVEKADRMMREQEVLNRIQDEP
ncbi:unnamed protein product [Dicrocoelium dendriticum]|nr:unnamed protein product [Dicrocoelium dendriticum]